MIVEAFESFTEEQLKGLGQPDPSAFLTFIKKDCLLVEGVSENGWWLGQKLASKEDIQSKIGKQGYFPSNFVVQIRSLTEEERKELWPKMKSEEKEKGKDTSKEKNEKEKEKEDGDYLTKRYGINEKEEEPEEEEPGIDWANYARQNFLSKKDVWVF
jgi:hypothetical protein